MGKVHRGKLLSVAEFARLWGDETLTIYQIADRLGISPSGVGQRARARKLPPRAGGAGKNRKIDPVLFREMWDANVGIKDIADHFGTSQTGTNRRARLWGFPRRNCTRWNSTPITQFLETRLAARMAEAARIEQAALVNAEMVDGKSSKRAA